MDTDRRRVRKTFEGIDLLKGHDFGQNVSTTRNLSLELKIRRIPAKNVAMELRIAIVMDRMKTLWKSAIEGDQMSV